MSKKAKHQSVDKHAEQIISKLESLEEVTKIVIGLSVCIRHAFTPGMAKLKARTEAGFRINVYGGNGITSVFVVCSDIDGVLKAIRR